MKKILLSTAALVLSASVVFAKDTTTDYYVVDPVSGEIVLYSSIDLGLLTEEELVDLDAQIAALEATEEDGEQIRTRVSEDEGQGETLRYRYETQTREQTQAKVQTKTMTRSGGAAGGASQGGRS